MLAGAGDEPPSAGLPPSAAAGLLARHDDRLHGGCGRRRGQPAGPYDQRRLCGSHQQRGALGGAGRVRENPKALANCDVRLTGYVKGDSPLNFP
eukprot:scaffold234771_cov20-Prasinocladus_malaysianus.AAC.1